MREMNRDRDQPRESNLDDLDRALDAALSNYAVVEPRAGLAGRILANLHTQSMAARQAWWRWGLIGALAAIVIVAMTLAWKNRQKRPCTHCESCDNHATDSRACESASNSVERAPCRKPCAQSPAQRDCAAKTRVSGSGACRRRSQTERLSFAAAFE